MISLDDERAVRAADPAGLLDAFTTLPQQLRVGLELGRGVEVPGDGPPDAVVLCGVGGSAAAADLVAAAVAPRSGVPVLVMRGAGLPRFVSERTLVVCLSYSGTTRETLEVEAEAAARTRRLVCVASGGDLASGRNGPAVVLPGGVPSPRAALGWLVGASLGILERGGAIASHEDGASALDRVIAGLSPDVPADRNPAKMIARWLGERVPVVWGSNPAAAAAAFRWKAGFNENAEIPAFASYLPELLHHEVVGWTKRWAESFAVIVLRSSEDSAGPDAPEENEKRSDARLRGALDLLEDAGIEHREVDVPAAGVEEHLGLFATGDFASAYHAIARGVDPTPIEAIRRLKERFG